MYRILGGDGNVYGPVSADTLRQWIGENRLNGDSRVQRENGEWRTLREFPELAELLPGGAVGSAPSATAASAPLTADYQLDIGDTLAKGWRLLQSDFGLLFGATLLFLLISGGLSLLGQIPLAGVFASLTQFVIGGPLAGGLFYLFLRRLRGEPVQLGDMFDGFRHAFLQLFLAQFVTNLLGVLCMIPVGVVGVILLGPKFVQLAERGSVGDPSQLILSMLSEALAPLVLTVLLCAVPLAVISVRLSFTTLLVLDRRIEFWPAIKLSWQRTGMHFWSCLGTAMLTGIVVAAGVLLCGIGLLFTMPIGFACYAVAYQTVFRSAHDQAN
jgi:uncharacterized membrane protein